MQLVLIRAAEPASAPADAGLSADGHRQARLLAAALQAERWDALYHSSEPGAAPTSAAVSEALGLASHPLDVSPGAIVTIRRVIDAHPGERVLVIADRETINANVGAIWGMGEKLDHEPAFTGVTRVLASRQGDVSIESLNETGHLCDAEDRATTRGART